MVIAWRPLSACALLLIAVAGCTPTTGATDPALPAGSLPHGSATGTVGPSSVRSGHPTARLSPPSRPSTAAAPATPRTSGRPAGADPSTPTPRASAPVPTADAPVRACTSADLAVSAGTTGLPLTGVHGDFSTRILLRNTSPTDCRLRGWAGVSVYGDSTLHACMPGDTDPTCGKVLSTSEPRTLTVSRSGQGTPPEVRLSHGTTTSFSLLYTGSGGVSDACPDNRLWSAPYGGDIRVPGDTRPLPLVPFPAITPCDGRIQVTAFGVPG